jgi:hypothetical protein
LVFHDHGPLLAAVELDAAMKAPEAPEHRGTAMRSLKRAVISVLIFLLSASSALAAESGLKSIFEDVCYGALSGGLVGAAVLAFTGQPGRHLVYIGYGAAGGALVGATYGAVSTTRSLAELKNGEVSFAMPSIMPEIRESRSRTAIVATAELLRGTF